MVMNSIDWLGSACDPAVVLDIGYKTLPHEFFIGLNVWRAGHCLPECLSSLSPSFSVSQGWWRHPAGLHYWIRMTTAWFFWAESNFLCLCEGLRVVMCFPSGWHHRVTSRYSNLKSFPVKCALRETKTVCHSALAFSWPGDFPGDGALLAAGALLRHSQITTHSSNNTREKEHQPILHDGGNLETSKSPDTRTADSSSSNKQVGRWTPGSHPHLVV